MFHVKQSEGRLGKLIATCASAWPSMCRPLRRLFHVKQVRRVLVAFVLLLAVPVLVACDVADQPDGWAAPTLDPVEPETRLIAPTGEDQVVAVQLLDGNLGSAVWEFPDDDGNFPGLDGEIEPVAFYADPVWVEATDEWLLAGYSDGVLYAVQRDGESARVIFDSEDRLVADMVVDGSRVYLADTAYKVYAVDIEQPGEAVWTWDGDSGSANLERGPALVETDRGRLLVVAGFDGRVTAINVDGELAGRSAWQIQIESGIARGNQRIRWACLCRRSGPHAVWTRRRDRRPDLGDSGFALALGYAVDPRWGDLHHRSEGQRLRARRTDRREALAGTL